MEFSRRFSASQFKIADGFADSNRSNFPPYPMKLVTRLTFPLFNRNVAVSRSSSTTYVVYFLLSLTVYLCIKIYGCYSLNYQEMIHITSHVQ